MLTKKLKLLMHLKTKFKTNLEEGKKHEAEHKVRDAVVEKAAENAEIDIPEANDRH